MLSSVQQAENGKGWVWITTAANDIPCDTFQHDLIHDLDC